MSDTKQYDPNDPSTQQLIKDYTTFKASDDEEYTYGLTEAQYQAFKRATENKTIGTTEDASHVAALPREYYASLEKEQKKLFAKMSSKITEALIDKSVTTISKSTATAEKCILAVDGFRKGETPWYALGYYGMVFALNIGLLIGKRQVLNTLEQRHENAVSTISEIEQAQPGATTQTVPEEDDISKPTIQTPPMGQSPTDQSLAGTPINKNASVVEYPTPVKAKYGSQFTEEQLAEAQQLKPSVPDQTPIASSKEGILERYKELAQQQEEIREAGLKAIEKERQEDRRKLTQAEGVVENAEKAVTNAQDAIDKFINDKGDPNLKLEDFKAKAQDIDSLQASLNEFFQGKENTELAQSYFALNQQAKAKIDDSREQLKPEVDELEKLNSAKSDAEKVKIVAEGQLSEEKNRFAKKEEEREAYIKELYKSGSLEELANSIQEQQSNPVQAGSELRPEQNTLLTNEEPQRQKTVISVFDSPITADSQSEFDLFKTTDPNYELFPKRHNQR